MFERAFHTAPQQLFTPVPVRRRVAGVKQFLLMIGLVALVGCGKKEPVQPSASNTVAGVKLWEYKTGSGVYSSPAIGSDGTVYVGSGDKKLYAIKTESLGLAKSPWPMSGQNLLHTGRVIKK